MLSYPAAVDLSTRTLRYAAGLLRAHRRLIGSRWRKLGYGRQALLVLAHLRCGDTYVRLAAGSGVGVATVHRYVAEMVDLLAAAAPGLAAAMDRHGHRTVQGLRGAGRHPDQHRRSASTGSACAPALTGRTTPGSTSGTG